MKRSISIAFLSLLLCSTFTFANKHRAALAAARYVQAQAAKRTASKAVSPVFEIDPHDIRVVQPDKRTVFMPLCTPTTCKKPEPPRNVAHYKRKDFVAFHARVWMAKDFTFYDDNGVATVMDWANENRAQVVEWQLEETDIEDLD